MYRITRTDFQRKGQWHTVWQGLCAVVELGEKLVFPNGDAYKYKLTGAELKILEGPHRGTYLYTYLGNK